MSKGKNTEYEEVEKLLERIDCKGQIPSHIPKLLPDASALLDYLQPELSSTCSVQHI